MKELLGPTWIEIDLDAIKQNIKNIAANDVTDQKPVFLARNGHDADDQLRQGCAQRHNRDADHGLA